jgi:hypothetical protein
MRRLLLLPPALLAACATAPPPPEPAEIPVHGQTAGHTCNAAGTERFVGQPGTSETGAAIQRATNAAVLRWAPPGYLMTMEYREDRVTVHLGPDRKVTRVACG